VNTRSHCRRRLCMWRVLINKRNLLSVYRIQGGVKREIFGTQLCLSFVLGADCGKIRAMRRRIVRILPPGAPACAPCESRGRECRRLASLIPRMRETFLRVFIQKLCRYWADRASEGSLASKPMQGDKMRVFSRLCARFPGWLPMCFFARKRFSEVCATNFLANRAGICPHIARRVIGTRGTRCAQNINAPTVGTGGRSYGLGFRV